jgi:hypothetical protein
MPAIRQDNHRGMLAPSVVIQESLSSVGGKLKSAFPHSIRQRPRLVREHRVLGFLQKVANDGDFLARTLWPRIIYSAALGADHECDTAHQAFLSHARLRGRGLLFCSESTQKLTARQRAGRRNSLRNEGIDENMNQEQRIRGYP